MSWGYSCIFPTNHKMEEIQILADRQKQYIDHIHAALDSLVIDVENCKTTSVSNLKKPLKDKMDIVQREHKEFNSHLTKFCKFLEKEFQTNVEEAFQEWDFDSKIIFEIILEYFYQTGDYAIGEVYAKESNQYIKNIMIYEQISKFLQELECRDYDRLLEWCELHQCIDLKCQIHQARFIHLVTAKRVNDAIVYAKTHLRQQPDRVQWLMGSLVYMNSLEKSPYSKLLSFDLGKSFLSQYCLINEIPSISPLYILISSGIKALPVILKFISKNIENLQLKSSQMPIEMESDFLFHSIFSCPVSKEISMNPMLLPCNHVISLTTMEKLRGNRNTFKCPYCPQDCGKHQAKEIHF